MRRKPNGLARDAPTGRQRKLLRRELLQRLGLLCCFCWREHVAWLNKVSDYLERNVAHQSPITNHQATKRSVIGWRLSVFGYRLLVIG